MDEPKKRLLNSLRTEAGVFSEVTSLPGGRRRRPQHPRSGDPSALLQQAGRQRAHRRIARPGPPIDEAIGELLRPPGARGMKTTVPHWLARGLVGLFVVAARSRPTTAQVLRPALVVGVVDVAEVYRAKEAEFTQILTKTLSQPPGGRPPEGALHGPAFAQRPPLAPR